MTLDELIDALIEAKEHGVDGRTEVKVYSDFLQSKVNRIAQGSVSDIEYDSKKVYLYYAE